MFVVIGNLVFLPIMSFVILAIAYYIHKDLVQFLPVILILGCVFLGAWVSDKFGVSKQQMFVYKLYKQFPEYFYKRYTTEQVIDDYTFKRVIDRVSTTKVLWDFIEFNKLEMKYSKEMYDDDTFFNEYKTKIVPRIKKNPELIIFRII